MGTPLNYTNDVYKVYVEAHGYELELPTQRIP